MHIIGYTLFKLTNALTKVASWQNPSSSRLRKDSATNAFLQRNPESTFLHESSLEGQLYQKTNLHISKQKSSVALHILYWVKCLEGLEIYLGL